MHHYGLAGFGAERRGGDWLAVAVRPGQGLGVRALARFAPGAVLDRFSGKIRSEIAPHSLQVAPGAHICDTRFVGYISHGCAPNCRLDMARFELVALRDIAEGEWLTIDYAATEDRLYAQFACLCGASRCRGWIAGRSEAWNDAGLRRRAAGLAA